MVMRQGQAQYWVVINATPLSQLCDPKDMANRSRMAPQIKWYRAMNIQVENTVVEFDRSKKHPVAPESGSRPAPIFYTELKRRNVLRTAAAYIVVAWLVAQVADVLCDGFGAPDWVMRAVLIALALGLPIAIILSWYFEFTASVRWDPDTEPIGAIARQKGRKLDFAIIIVLTLIVSTLLVWRPEAPAVSDIVCVPGQQYTEHAPDSGRSVSTANAASQKANKTAN